MPTKQQYKLAETILVDAQEAFYFGANNKGSTPHSCIQARFIEKQIHELSERKELNLKKFSFKIQKEIKAVRKEYIATKNMEKGFRLLSLFYGYPALQKKFEEQERVNWNENWFVDLNLILATSYLEQYRKKCYNKGIFSIEDTRTYDKLRIDGVPDEGSERKIYFERTLFDIKAATLYGVAACEIMAEFALFDAIRMSKDLDCEIHYIRFLSEHYEEINAIALGEWPNKKCLIVCPWLGEKNKGIVWQGNLQNTPRFSHYSSVKTMLKITSGEEMDGLRKALAPVDSLADTKKQQTIKSEIEECSERYKKAFGKCFLNEHVIESQSTSIKSLGR